MLLPTCYQGSVRSKRGLSVTPLAHTGRVFACCATIAAGLAAYPMRAAEPSTKSLYAPAGCEELQRAGCPNEQSGWARVENPCRYTGYYVGGSVSSHQNMRQCCNQGTWGWDYSGRYIMRLVRLDFCCPSPYQGGPGNYKPDGPRVCEALHRE